MAQNCRAPVRVRRHPDTFCRSLTMRISRSDPLLSRGYPEVEGKPEVVVLAAGQPPGQGVVLLHQLPGPGRRLLDPDQGGGPVSPGPGRQRAWLDGGEALLHSVSCQALHGGECPGSPGGPAPLAVSGQIRDGLQLAGGMSAAKLVTGAGVSVIRRPGVGPRTAAGAAFPAGQSAE